MQVVSFHLGALILKFGSLSPFFSKATNVVIGADGVGLLGHSVYVQDSGAYGELLSA